MLSPRRWTLRARLIGTVVALLAVVCLVVGGAVTLSLRGFLYERLDKQVSDVTNVTLGRYNDDGGGPGPRGGDDGEVVTQLGFLNAPGLPPGTVGAHIRNGTVTPGIVGPPIAQLPRAWPPRSRASRPMAPSSPARFRGSGSTGWRRITPRTVT